jgi:hypothetical protein
MGDQANISPTSFNTTTYAKAAMFVHFDGVGGNLVTPILRTGSTASTGVALTALAGGSVPAANQFMEFELGFDGGSTFYGQYRYANGDLSTDIASGWTSWGSTTLTAAMTAQLGATDFKMAPMIYINRLATGTALKLDYLFCAVER